MHVEPWLQAGAAVASAAAATAAWATVRRSALRDRQERLQATADLVASIEAIEWSRANRSLRVGAPEGEAEVAVELRGRLGGLLAGTDARLPACQYLADTEHSVIRAIGHADSGFSDSRWTISFRAGDRLARATARGARYEVHAALSRRRWRRWRRHRLPAFSARLDVARRYHAAAGAEAEALLVKGREENDVEAQASAQANAVAEAAVDRAARTLAGV